ncbi:MAG: acetylxylan esterase [Phycisphaerae bacterium]|nr:acetylxylan esterase [Phycisphaerae bacterium]
MPVFDLPLDELSSYAAPPNEPADFDEFWARTLADTDKHPLSARFEHVEDSLYRLIDVYDVTFNGFGGQPVKGWFIEPAGTDTRRPCLVSFVGYGGGRGLPTDHLAPAVAGLAHFVMDTRGQGSGWSAGETADPDGSGPHYPGFMTRGIESPETYYYRRIFVDAVRAVQAAKSHPHVHGERVAVGGGSQGGGIAIAAAGLLQRGVKLLLADVPFLCHYRRATEITDRVPYSEIAGYLKCHRDRVDAVFKTLAYFDGVNFAARVRARAMFSVGLMDMTCPPSTVYAAYNQLRGEKDIRVYDYNDHEGGGSPHVMERLRFTLAHL